MLDFKNVEISAKISRCKVTALLGFSVMTSQRWVFFSYDLPVWGNQYTFKNYGNDYLERWIGCSSFTYQWGKLSKWARESVTDKGISESQPRMKLAVSAITIRVIQWLEADDIVSWWSFTFATATWLETFLEGFLGRGGVCGPVQCLLSDLDFNTNTRTVLQYTIPYMRLTDKRTS